MKTPYGHLTYCSNIHPGVSWDEHFGALRENLPYIRNELAGNAPFALGLRCAHEASLELEKPERITEFKNWLDSHNLYVSTINGFPYGNFHGTFVKDHVHQPDWTTEARTAYTLRLFRILVALLPENGEGGVSTPPLSYRFWWKTEAALKEATTKATLNMLRVADSLITLREETGKTLHLDVEPEPDGILDNGADFFKWYADVLLPLGITYLKESRGYAEAAAREAVLTHIGLCYDVCHFAVSYESPATVMETLRRTGIRAGKIQVSSALQVDLKEQSGEKLAALRAFNEPVYLHQVVARTATGILHHYRDLDEAFAADSSEHTEWRVHFHVPLFLESFGLLKSTQKDIVETLALYKQFPLTPCLEVETYTWGVLPEAIQKPVGESIVRELQWVQQQLTNPITP